MPDVKAHVKEAHAKQDKSQKKKKIQASHFQIEENKEKEKTLEEAYGNNSKWYWNNCMLTCKNK